MAYHLILTLLISATWAAPQDDKVDLDALKNTTNGNVTINSTTYSGYLNITDEKQLHYLFIQSWNDYTN